MMVKRIPLPPNGWRFYVIGAICYHFKPQSEIDYWFSQRSLVRLCAQKRSIVKIKAFPFVYFARYNHFREANRDNMSRAKM